MDSMDYNKLQTRLIFLKTTYIMTKQLKRGCEGHMVK